MNESMREPTSYLNFYRPKDPKKVSNHLFIGNCGYHTSIDKEQLEIILSKFGPCFVYMVPSRSIAFASFQNCETARKALEGLNKVSLQSYNGHKLLLAYATLSDVPRNTQKREKFDCIEDALIDNHLKVPGLYILENIISEKEELELISLINREKWDTSIKRRVQHYGYKFNYDTRHVDRVPLMNPDQSSIYEHGSILPSFVSNFDLLFRIKKNFPMLDCFNQLTINEYPPGQGISAHVDTHSAFEDGIASLSLGSNCTMVFLHPGTSVKINIPLVRRSALIMTGPSRYQWLHSIPHRKYDRISGNIRRRDTRISLTFRSVRHTECRCVWPDQCDSQNMGPAKNLNSKFQK